MNISGIQPDHTPLIVQILPTLILSILVLSMIIIMLFFKKVRRRTSMIEQEIKEIKEVVQGNDAIK